MFHKVLITGATGFVGANLARRLLRDGHELHLILRHQYQSWRIDEIKGDVNLHILDLADQERAAMAVAKIKPDWVFHLAVHGAYPEQTDFSEMTRVNVVQTASFLRACLRSGFAAFVNAGSSSEYGYKSSAPSEDEMPEPNSDYAVSKLSSTMHCRYLATKYRAHISTLRLYSVFGPYEQPTRLIPRLVSRGLRGELPPLAGPETARDFIYAEDVCEAFIAVASTPQSEPGSIYNVGSGTETKLHEIVSHTRRLLNMHAEPVWGSMPARIWDTPSWVCDNRKIQRETGWRLRTSIADGLQKTIDWFQQHPEMHARYLS